MAASEVLTKYKTEVEPTISLASIANGAGRICAVVDNTTTRALAYDLYAKVKSGGTGPTANSLWKWYIIAQSNGSNNVKGGGGSLGDVDAAVSTEPTNAELVGSIVAGTGVNTSYSERVGRIDNPPAKFSIVFWNACGQTINATPDTPAVQLVPLTVEGQ